MPSNFSYFTLYSKTDRLRSAFRQNAPGKEKPSYVLVCKIAAVQEIDNDRGREDL